MPKGVPTPRFHLTPEVLSKIETFASRGLTMEQIALAIGVSASTLHKRKSTVAEVGEAIKRGQAKGLATVANQLFKAAEDGKPWAICFYLKTRGGSNWKETEHHIISGPGDGPVEIANATEAIRRKLIPEAFED